MFCRPIITDVHVQKALTQCKTHKKNTLNYNRAWARALRLVQMKTEQTRFISEGEEIESILKTLPAED
jgi:hypothetical protein